MSISLRVVFRRALLALTAAVCCVIIAGCCNGKMPNNWKQSFDPPMNYEGREEICLYNLERILDAKQEWARDTGAGVGQLSPSTEVLAHKYFRKYEYGRRAECDDDTQNLPIFQPICPRGGEYIIGTVGQRPKCSVCGDLLRDYDTKIRMTHTH